MVWDYVSLPCRQSLGVLHLSQPRLSHNITFATFAGVRMDPNLAQNAGAAALGVLVLFVGLLGWIWVGRRQYRRRNSAGIEEFSGYGGMLVSKGNERLVRLFCALAVIAGLLLMARAVKTNMANHAVAKHANSLRGEPIAPTTARKDRRSSQPQ